MASSSPWINPARLWFCVFLLLAVAVVAAQARPVQQSRAVSAERSIGTTRGPLYCYVIEVARGLGRVSVAAIAGRSAD